MGIGSQIDKVKSESAQTLQSFGGAVALIVGHAAGRTMLTTVEAVSALELERSVFDSAETQILSAAFARAWTFVESDPALGALDVAERQSELARCLMAILKIGETNPTSLANSGIALLRRSQRSYPELQL